MAQQRNRSLWRKVSETITLFAVGVSGCAYDFDHFARLDSGIAAGGSTSAEGGVGNLGGTNGATTWSAAGGNNASTTASTKACAGILSSAVCWYLGAAGESCDQVCSPHGQVVPDAASFVGMPAQGGSAEECGLLLNLLGVNATVQSGQRTDGSGLGCHVYMAVPWWLSAPAYTSTASEPLARRVCGCSL